MCDVVATVWFQGKQAQVKYHGEEGYSLGWTEGEMIARRMNVHTLMRRIDTEAKRAKKLAGKSE